MDMQRSTQSQVVQIPVKNAVLEGELCMPTGARGVVTFAHGSGSSRHSPRNQYVARVLNQAGLATLLMDLLTRREEEAEQFTRHLRFDISMLAERLGETMKWLATQPLMRSAAMGIFGASTGGAAAIVAAAEHPREVRAVVSRGGRPDLAGSALMSLKTPTLLIVGGADYQVIELNSKAYNRMQGVKRMEIVPGATHLFEEPGALERVAELARDWFQNYLR